MKTDLRVIKSRAAIESSFINLVEIKGFQNVTLTEIAEKAMVNRNTIYINYGSKEEILESIIKNSITKYFGIVTEDSFKKIGLNKKKIADAFNKLFSAIDENIELYRILLTDPSSIGYLETETRRLRKNVEALFKPTAKNDVTYSFLFNGVWGVVRSYIVYAKATKEENVKVLTDLVLSNLRHLSYSK